VRLNARLGRVLPAVAAVAAIAALLLPTLAAAATLTPTVWKAGYENELNVRVTGADCAGYDLSMIDRLQLKDPRSTAAAFYEYEPTLLDPDVESEPGIYEGPVLVQKGATNGLHQIDVYCNETSVKVGSFEVTVIDGKPAKKPKHCKPGQVSKHGKCVNHGPVKVPPHHH
jgi:hypothetical protein